MRWVIINKVTGKLKKEKEVKGKESIHAGRIPYT